MKKNVEKKHEKTKEDGVKKAKKQKESREKGKGRKQQKKKGDKAAPVVKFNWKKC